METTPITPMGCNWMGGSWTTLYGSVVGAGWPRNQSYGTSRPISGGEPLYGHTANEMMGGYQQVLKLQETLFFAQFILKKTLGIFLARDVRAHITIWMDLLERVIHAGLVGDVETNGESREGSASREE